ncbi:MAG TPA: DmsE family decaheme c-type cytochrome [Bryobacteraceae bacterium]|nr:DmsE family decaheme c-type cytochrome [Bryobacteraceae bacterium]
MRVLPLGAVLGFLCAQVWAQDQAPSQPKPLPDAAAYAGSEVCRKCHLNVWNGFFRNPHFKSLAAPEPAKDAGCEGCHGPGARHVAAMGGKATIIAFSELSKTAAMAKCLACHVRDEGKSHIRRSSHTLANVVCTDCHSIHRSPVPRNLLARQQRDLCYACHANVRAQFSMPSKHRVNEGLMQCTDCHNPHGASPPSWRMGLRPRMVEQASGPEEACIKCHSDKRGPFVFEHAAVRVDGCETCHTPHGSTNAKLLRRPVTFTLCLECHSGAGNFGRQSDGITLTPVFHNMTDPQFQYCTSCHVRIHGSNADPRFLR